MYGLYGCICLHLGSLVDKCREIDHMYGVFGYFKRIVCHPHTALNKRWLVTVGAEVVIICPDLWSLVDLDPQG